MKKKSACHYGGNEFAIWFSDISVRGILPILNRIQGKIKAIVIPDSEQNQPGTAISAGIACFPQNGTTTEAFLKAADKALYEVKRSGRDGAKQVST